MAIEVMTGPAPARKMRGMRNPEVYETAAALEPGQWFVWPEGKAKCLASYKKTAKRIAPGAEVYIDARGRVVFAHTRQAAAGTTPPQVVAEPVRRGPGRPRLTPPAVDPRVAALGRR